MTVHVTYLTSEAMPEPGELRRVVSVHPGNRTYETAPVGHDTGWLVADPNGTNSVYWTDDEVDEVHPSGQWVKRAGVPAAVISRHGERFDPGTWPGGHVLAPEKPRIRRPRRQSEAATHSTGGGVNVPEPTTSASKEDAE